MVVVTALLIVVGIAGTLLPILPGVALIWASTLVYGLVDGFGTVGWVAFGLITALAVASAWLGVRVPQKAAAGGSIGWRGQLLALGTAVVGFFVIPVLGAALGFVAGVYLAAVIEDRTHALTTTRSTIRALFIASGIQFAAACTMGLVWVGWVLAS
jgi:uncharacterized protein